VLPNFIKLLISLKRKRSASYHSGCELGHLQIVQEMSTGVKNGICSYFEKLI